MARQPRTRQPKAKFLVNKIYTCGRCQRQINDFHLEKVNGELTTVCHPKRPCATPTV